MADVTPVSPDSSPLGRFRPAIVLGLLVALHWGPLVRAQDAAADPEVVRLRRALAEKERQIERLNAELAARPPAPAPPAPPPSIASVLPDPPPHVAPSPPTPATIPKTPDLGHSALFDNLAFAVGIDGSKQPQDFGINALFGARTEVNWGVPLVKDWGLGLQVGTALNPSSNAVGVIERVQGTKGRLQSFTTVGLFGRYDRGWNWAVGHDFLYEQYFGHFHLGQWRGQVGFDLDKRNEVGARLMLRSYGATGHFNAVPVSLSPIDMGTLFWRHTWIDGPAFTAWAGLGGTHHQPNAALGDAAVVRHPFVFGAQVEAPLNDHMALFGQANFINPPSTGTVDAFLGIVFTPADRARRERSRLSRPVLPVANNPTFAVDLARRR